MPLTSLDLGAGGQPPIPRWRWSVLRGIILALAVLILLAFAPLLLGKPIRPGTIYIVSRPKTHADCEVERSLKMLVRVYGVHKFSFVVTDSDQDPRIDECAMASPTIYLGQSLSSDAAHSIYQEGCRFIGVAPDHPDFCARTIAHEFGHHRFGDVGMPAWLWILNPIYDGRNNLIIWLGTVAS